MVGGLENVHSGQETQDCSEDRAKQAATIGILILHLFQLKIAITLGTLYPTMKLRRSAERPYKYLAEKVPTTIHLVPHFFIQNGVSCHNAEKAVSGRPVKHRVRYETWSTDSSVLNLRSHSPHLKRCFAL